MQYFSLGILNSPARSLFSSPKFSKIIKTLLTTGCDIQFRFSLLPSSFLVFLTLIHFIPLPLSPSLPSSRVFNNNFQFLRNPNTFRFYIFFYNENNFFFFFKRGGRGGENTDLIVRKCSLIYTSLTTIIIFTSFQP